MIASIAAIAAKIITATIEMASAFSHPVSKKYFTNASQIISWMMETMKPIKTAPKSEPTTVPMATIQMASVNFAFSVPTNHLPDSQRTGDSRMVFTIMLIASISKFTAVQISPSF